MNARGIIRTSLLLLWMLLVINLRVASSHPGRERVRIHVPVKSHTHVITRHRHHVRTVKVPVPVPFKVTVPVPIKVHVHKPASGHGHGGYHSSSGEDEEFQDLEFDQFDHYKKWSRSGAKSRKHENKKFKLSDDLSDHNLDP